MLVNNKGLGSAGSGVGVAVGSTIMASAPLAGPAAPVVVVVGALVALGSTIAGALHVGEGCGPTCIQATALVNQVEPVMLANVKAYQANNFDEQVALNNFNQLWTTVLQGCGAIPGTAGENCISDRKEGACKWHDENGECWNWFKGYRDPLLIPNGVNSQSGGGSDVIGGSVSDVISTVQQNPMLLLGLAFGLIALGSSD